MGISQSLFIWRLWSIFLRLTPGTYILRMVYWGRRLFPQETGLRRFRFSWLAESRRREGIGGSTNTWRARIHPPCRHVQSYVCPFSHPKRTFLYEEKTVHVTLSPSQVVFQRLLRNLNNTYWDSELLIVKGNYRLTSCVRNKNVFSLLSWRLLDGKMLFEKWNNIPHYTLDLPEKLILLKNTHPCSFSQRKYTKE